MFRLVRGTNSRPQIDSEVSTSGPLGWLNMVILQLCVGDHAAGGATRKQAHQYRKHTQTGTGYPELRESSPAAQPISIITILLLLFLLGLLL